MQYFISLDLDRCTGCYACAVACMDHNTLHCHEERPYRRWIFPIEEALENNEPVITYLPLACLHCHNAPCVPSCPTEAIELRENGIVAVIPSACIGCRACMIACPFGIPRFNKAGTMEKCTLCSDRIEEGLEPACVRTCPTQALTFRQESERSATVETINPKKRIIPTSYRIKALKQS